MSLSTATLAHSSAIGIEKEMMVRFVLSNENLKVISTQLLSGNFEAILQMATEIKRWAVKMLDYCPNGGNQKPSVAKTELWTDFNRLKKAGQTHHDAADGLMSDITLRIADASMAAFLATAATYKSYHQPFGIN